MLNAFECFLFIYFFCLCVFFYRDDTFSDTLSQKADSEASSGHGGEEKCSTRDIGSPTDNRIPDTYISR